MNKGILDSSDFLPSFDKKTFGKLKVTWVNFPGNRLAWQRSHQIIFSYIQFFAHIVSKCNFLTKTKTQQKHACHDQESKNGAKLIYCDRNSRKLQVLEVAL